MERLSCRNNYELCRKFVDRSVSIVVGVNVVIFISQAYFISTSSYWALYDLLQSRTLWIDMGLMRLSSNQDQACVADWQMTPHIELHKSLKGV